MKERKGLLECCLGKAQDLNSLIEYAPDSVVSKTLLDKQAGTITLFAFDQGQKLSEHTAKFDAVVQVIDGRGLLIIDGEEIEVSAGRIIIMPANIPHAVNAQEKFKMLLTMIREQ